MEEFKKLLKWEVLVFLFGIGSAVVSAYFANTYKNEMQDQALQKILDMERQHDNRITSLEHRQNIVDTQNAVIRVQLDAIQADIKDIKMELKRK